MKLYELLHELEAGKRLKHESVPDRELSLGKKTETVLAWCTKDSNQVWEHTVADYLSEGWSVAESNDVPPHDASQE